MERIRRQIEVDIDQDEHSAHPKGLTHRRMDSVMTDAGSEFQVTFKAWLAREGISSITCAPETHEEMSRLNSFHRYFRQRYQTQWQKYHQNPREYGGPVRWISPQARSDGFVAPDAEEEAVAAEAKDIELTRFEPEDQKLAVAACAWNITYWEDWVKSHNETVKANSLRGATMREKGGENVPYHVARRPADIGDAMVHNLVRYDAARREVVKQRVDDWMKDNNVLTMADLSDSEQGYATRVRLDLNRTKFGKELKNKATTFLSIWSQRHYPLVRRVGTNTFEVQHSHETDFPDVWPMYRMRLVKDPSNVAQPSDQETKVNPGRAEAVSMPVNKLKAQEMKDMAVLAKVHKEEEKAMQVQRQTEETRHEGLATIAYNTRSRTRSAKKQPPQEYTQPLRRSERLSAK